MLFRPPDSTATPKCDHSPQSIEAPPQPKALQDQFWRWSFGAHFTTKFRLTGSWAWEGAIDVLVTDEFWYPIKRLPLFLAYFLVSILKTVMCVPLSVMSLIYHSLLSYERSWKDYEWWNEIQNLKGMILDFLGF